MKKKNGFIAVSLIYSFFLFFLMVMLATSTKTIHARQLLKIYKDDLKAELNQDAFVELSIPAKTYSINEEVNFVGETWQVIRNNSNSVVLILKRSLNKNEITKALNTSETNVSYFQNSCNDTLCRVRMCLNQASNQFCYYASNANALNYSWETSIGKVVLERWFAENANLQKVCDYKYQESTKQYECQKNTLIKMNFTDQRKNYSEYIRLANYLTEVRTTSGGWVSNARNSWTLTSYEVNPTTKKSRLYGMNGTIYQNETVLTLHPVIEVRKG